MPDSVGGASVAERLDHSLNRLRRATVILYLITIVLFIAGFLYVYNYQADNRKIIVSTTSALCALKVDMEARIIQGQDFLSKNPDGIPGITPEAIQQQLDNTQRTLNALSEISCPPLAPIQD